MSTERAPVLTYAGAKDGRYRSGVPRRDLYAEDVARLAPAVVKDITGGENPLYVPSQNPPRAKAAKAAPAEESASPADGGEE